eukprot:s2323_g21.t1
MKRKLDPSDTPVEQFQALRQIRGLSQEDCRRVIGLLRDDERGAATCRKDAQKYPQASKLLREVKLPDTNLVVHLNTVPDLLQEKIEQCGLFAHMMKEALKKGSNALTLLMFADEANPGNILAARHPRKSNLYYFTFWEFPLLHVEGLWLPLAVIRANEVTEAKSSYAEVTRAVLEHVYDEVEDGFALSMDGEAEMVFVREVILLNDHEGLRSVSGSKGASGAKPCCHCINVLANGRTCPRGFVTIQEMDASQFVRQTDAGLQEIQNHFDACTTKQSLSKAEVILGWNARELRRSIFSSEKLKPWISLDCLLVDTMHQYFSHGLVAQELGLWFGRFLAAVFSLQLLQNWISIGWKRTKDSLLTPAACCKEHLFRENSDYRGDASACATALPLVWAFSQEILHEHAGMQTAITSLNALHAVVTCLHKMKWNPARGEALPRLQEKHMIAFQRAYDASLTRPKAHYALHVWRQVLRWGRHADCYVGERKHRIFKSQVAPKMTNLTTFSKSWLLQLTEMELMDSQEARSYTGQLLGKPRAQPSCAHLVHLPQDTMFAHGLKYQCVEYEKGMYLLLSNECAVQAGVACSSFIELNTSMQSTCPSTMPKASQATGLAPLGFGVGPACPLPGFGYKKEKVSTSLAMGAGSAKPSSILCWMMRWQRLSHSTSCDMLVTDLFKE